MTAEVHPFPPEEVMAYLDGEVTGQRAIALADHLEHCTECASLADDFCTLSRHLVAWKVEPSLLKQPSLPVAADVDAWCSEAATDPTLNAENPSFSYSEPREARPAPRSSLLRGLTWPFIHRPWIWGLGSAFAALLIVSFVSFKLGRVAPKSTTSNVYEKEWRDEIARYEKEMQDEIARVDQEVEKARRGGSTKQASARDANLYEKPEGSILLDQSQALQGRTKRNNQANQKITALDTSVHSELTTKASADDVKTVDTKVVGVRTDLDTTKEDLKMAKSEIGTLIAHNHQEIDQLRRLGERDYIEFTLTGKNRPQKVADVILELRDVNEKRDRFDLAMTVEDKSFLKTNRIANEPIFFYASGSHIPEEIVINKIGRDSVSGYVSVSVGKMIERTASLSLIVKKVEAARAALEEIAKRHDGYFAELNTSGQPNEAHTLTASLRVPATELDSTLAELRRLGQLDEEKQGGEEVSRQYVDLRARLENAGHTEKRLTELLAKRADRLKDVLDVERELAATREEIERMEAEQRNMQQLVNYASIELQLREEYKPALNLAPPGVGTRMRNALVDGYHAAADSVVNVILFALQSGPVLLFWLLVLFFPVRWAWRKLRAVTSRKPLPAGAV